MTAPEGDQAPTVTVSEGPGGWRVVEDGRVVSRHAEHERAQKAALDWASRQFEKGRRLVVVLG